MVEGREGKGRAGRARARKGWALIEHLLELDEDLELALSELSSLRLDRQVILITQPTWDWESELVRQRGRNRASQGQVVGVGKYPHLEIGSKDFDRFFADRFLLLR